VSDSRQLFPLSYIVGACEMRTRNAQVGEVRLATSHLASRWGTTCDLTYRKSARCDLRPRISQVGEVRLATSHLASRRDATCDLASRKSVTSYVDLCQWHHPSTIMTSFINSVRISDHRLAPICANVITIHQTDFNDFFITSIWCLWDSLLFRHLCRRSHICIICIALFCYMSFSLSSRA